MMLECAAFVSLIILAVNLLIKGGVYLYKRHYVKRRMSHADNPKSIRSALLPGRQRDPMTQRRLADSLGRSLGTVNKTLNELGQLGYVHQEPHHRRAA